jgi:hypothetical protein
VVSFSYWSIKPWFLTEEKLIVVRIIPSSWGSQLVVNTTHQHFPLSLTSENKNKKQKDIIAESKGNNFEHSHTSNSTRR